MSKMKGAIMMECRHCGELMEVLDYEENYHDMFELKDKISQRWKLRCPCCHNEAEYYKIFVLQDEGWEK